MPKGRIANNGLGFCLRQAALTRGLFLRCAQLLRLATGLNLHSLFSASGARLHGQRGEYGLSTAVDSQSNRGHIAPPPRAEARCD